MRLRISNTDLKIRTVKPSINKKAISLRESLFLFLVIMYFNRSKPNQTPQMSCKNCSEQLIQDSYYCNRCGAKVVHDRITVKGILAEASHNFLGWDNKFLVTIKFLILKPRVLLLDYFNGTRKKYLDPFTFLTIAMAINLFAFNSFDEEFISVMDDFNKAQINWMSDTLGGPFADAAFKEEQLQKSSKSSKFMLKYFNLFVIVLLPIYTLMAYLVYRKPYNYAEHIVVNCYVQGFSFLSTTIIFFIAIWIHPSLYLFIYPLLILYYTYVYGKLYQLGIGESLLKIILFVAVLVGSIIAISIITFIFVLCYAYLTSRF